MIQLGTAFIFGLKKIRTISNIPFEAESVRIELSARECARAVLTFRDREETWLLGPYRLLNGLIWKLQILEKVCPRRPVPDRTSNLQPSTFNLQHRASHL